MHEITALKEVRKSIPFIDISKVKPIILKIYTTKNTNTELAIAGDIMLLPILSGVKRFGSVMEMKLFFKYVKITCQRNILTEPDVEPVHPPVKAKTINAVPIKGPQLR